MNRRAFSLATVLAGASATSLAASQARGPGPGGVAEAPASTQTVSAVALRTAPTLPPLDGAKGWLNSAPLRGADLRGKVVLIDFWTYSCINWLRTLPYLRAWAAKYKDQGLVVVGVHSPEFEFEKDIANIRRAVMQGRIGYPVAIDSDHAIWRAFDNRYWPALYIVDAHGKIRHHKFGEGDYEQLEVVIQTLLAEAGPKGTVPSGFVSVEASGPEVEASWQDLRSPETYLGSGRGERFASRGGTVPGKAKLYDIPRRLRVNGWALAGDWTVRQELAALNVAGGSIAYRFHARDVHLVMGPPKGGPPVRFRVLVDGQPPGGNRGVDVDDKGYGTATEPRLYQLVRQQQPIVDRTIQIEFFDGGIETYAFTFG